MGRDLPRFGAGQSWSEQSARQMNALVDEVRRLKGLVEFRGLNIPSGAKDRRTDRRELRTIDEKTVAIVKQPIAGDAVLVVREAGYATVPPQKCEGIAPEVECFYAWYGVDFEVYPPMGKQAIDYAGDEKTSRLVNDVPTDVLNSELEAPELGTVFHRCHREHEVWVLDSRAEGGAPIVFVRIIDKGGSSNSGQFLLVQKMKKVEPVAPETIVTWVPDGEPEYAECWPNYVVAHYMPMRFQNPEVIVPMMKVGGTQYVWQKNRMFLAKPVSSLPQSDCVVPIGS